MSIIGELLRTRFQKRIGVGAYPDVLHCRGEATDNQMKWPASYKHFICALLKRLLKVNAQWIEDSTHRAIQHQDWDWGRPYEKCDLFVVSGKNITLEEFISVLEKQYSDTDVARAIQELMMRCAHAEECVSEMKIQIERLKSEFPTKPH